VKKLIVFDLDGTLAEAIIACLADGDQQARTREWIQ
jgi:phosphoserine phosphatase